MCLQYLKDFSCILFAGVLLGISITGVVYINKYNSSSKSNQVAGSSRNGIGTNTTNEYHVEQNKNIIYSGNNNRITSHYISESNRFQFILINCTNVCVIDAAKYTSVVVIDKNGLTTIIGDPVSVSIEDQTCTIRNF